eukprot:Hpha_TRINITY_DN16526_c0_g7::TRINITY_DN16526_c0_g7_i1::g.133965::m.133965
MSTVGEADVRDVASTQGMSRASTHESSTQASSRDAREVRDEEQNRSSVVTHDPYQQEYFSGGEDAAPTEESTPRPSDDHHPLPQEPRCPPGGRQIVIVQRSPPHPFLMCDPCGHSVHCCGYASGRCFGDMHQGYAHQYDGWCRSHCGKHDCFGSDALRSLTNFDAGRHRKRRSGGTGGGSSSGGEAESATTATSSSRQQPIIGSRPPAPCRHFLEGTCYYGDECRFSHILTDDMERRRRLPPPVSPSEAPRTTGLCTSWYETKQYGFVRADGGPQAYVHSKRLADELGTRLQLGERYSFRLVPNDRDPGRWSAIDVIPESAAGSETSSTSDSQCQYQHHHHHHHHLANYHPHHHYHHSAYGQHHHHHLNQAYTECPHHHHHHNGPYMHHHHHHMLSHYNAPA